MARNPELPVTKAEGVSVISVTLKAEQIGFNVLSAVVGCMKPELNSRISVMYAKNLKIEKIKTKTNKKQLYWASRSGLYTIKSKKKKNSYLYIPNN